MVTAVRPLHPEKAELLIWVTLSGMVMAIRLLHPEKAELPIIVTLPGMVVFLQPATNVFDAVSIMALHPSRESYFALSSFTTIELRFMHLKKASLLMLVRPLPMVAEVRLLQPSKARLAMLATPFGISIETRLLQLRKAPEPIFITLSGIVTEVRLSQSPKALTPMLVTLYVSPRIVIEEGMLMSPVYLTPS